MSVQEIEVQIGHCSLQFSDTPAQWRHDADILFQQGDDWTGGTEAGEADNWAILKAAANRHGYTISRYKSNWIAIKRSNIRANTTVKWTTKTVIDNDLVAGKGHDTNYIAATWYHPNKRVGRLTHVVSHYPTMGDPSNKDPKRRINVRWTKKIAAAVVAAIVHFGAGTALAFYSGDQNMKDEVTDTFYGGRATSCWDELKKYPPTHGIRTIDVIASYDWDGRVRCVSARSFTDKQLFLYTDHYYIQARYRIRLLPATR